jgi:3-oxoacyl-[acyl-carrier protein] reductase
MDLGIGGRSAILMASSRGLGRACAVSLAREGVDVVVNGRTEEDVVATATVLSEDFGVRATPVVGDSADDSCHDALLSACPEPDIVLLNGSGPPPTGFDSIEPADWGAATQRTMVAPLAFTNRVLPGMRDRRFGRIVAISSAMVKSPNPLMVLSAGPRLGLTGVLKGLSKQVAKYDVTINTMLPERFDTGRQEYMAQMAMKLRGISYEEARAEQVASIRAGRLGRPEEFGDAFAFLCSAQAAYISGQSLQLDGGSYEGVF